MADQTKTTTRTGPAGTAPNVHSTRKRVKASSDAHKDVFRVRRLAAQALADLKRVSNLATPTGTQISRALQGFEALMGAAINTSILAREMIAAQNGNG